MRPVKTPLEKPKANVPTITARPNRKGIFVAGAALLILAAAFLVRQYSGSALLPGQSGAPEDQFDYLTRRGLGDAFHFVGALIKEGPDGAYEQTTKDFQRRVSLDSFAAYIRRYPAIGRIIRDEARIPPGAVTVDGGASSGPLPDHIRWEGYLPTHDELHGTVYLEMLMEDGGAKVSRIRVKKDELPRAKSSGH